MDKQDLNTRAVYKTTDGWLEGAYRKCLQVTAHRHGGILRGDAFKQVCIDSGSRGLGPAQRTNKRPRHALYTD